MKKRIIRYPYQYYKYCDLSLLLKELSDDAPRLLGRREKNNIPSLRAGLYKLYNFLDFIFDVVVKLFRRG